MKTISLGLPIAAAMLFLAPGLRAVDSTTPPPDQSASSPQSAQRRAQWIARFDKNGDGKLDDQERADAKAAMQQGRSAKAERRHRAMLKRYDKNGDGKLDEAERTAAFNDLSTRPRFVKRFDRDGDGKLSAEELAAAKQTLADKFAARGGPN
jgi:Ca2+-binding EF-hand superfamily protein